MVGIFLFDVHCRVLGRPMEGNPDLLVESRIEAPIVQNADGAFQGINLYPGNNATSFPNSYPLQCDLHLEYIIVREGFHCSWKLDGEVLSN